MLTKSDRLDLLYSAVSDCDELFFSGGEEQLESNMEAVSNPSAVSLWRRHGEANKSK